MSDDKTVSIIEIDAIVCQWTIDSGTPVSEKALNDLVDRIAYLFGVPIPKDGQMS